MRRRFLTSSGNRISSTDSSTSVRHHSNNQQGISKTNQHRSSHYRDVFSRRSSSSSAQRKASKDIQTEDMDISNRSRSLPGPSGSHSHSHQGHSHSHHHSNRKDGVDGTVSRDLKHTNSGGHRQQSGSGRVIHHNRSHHDEHRSSRSRSRSRDRERDRDRDRVDGSSSNRRERSRSLDRRSPSRDERRERDRDREMDGERDREVERDSGKRSKIHYDKDGTPERHPGGDAPVAAGLGLLGSLTALNSSSEPEIPNLHPSFAKNFREDLIAHVRDRHAECLERRADKYVELEVENAIQLSKVSAELNTARSLVRLADIQATLQEERLLFLRQQMKSLKESDEDSLAMLGVETGDS